MNKFLIFSAMFGISLAALFLSGAVGVLAVDQETNATVEADLTLTPTPNPMNFGPLMPGESNTIETTLTPGTSDLTVTVGVSDTIGGIFEDNLMIDIGAGFVVPETVEILIDADTPMDVDYMLDIPVGTPSGPYSATITYTVLENLP